MTVRDIGAEVRAHAIEAVEAQALGDDFGVDVVPGLTQGPRGLAVAYTIFITLRSPILGETALVNITQITNPRPSAEQVGPAMANAIRELRELSAQKLADRNGHTKAIPRQ